MTDSAERKEIDAFLNFFATFELSKPISTVEDLADGVALFDVLSVIDDTYFRQVTRPSALPSDNWVLRFGTLKRLYRLMTQYSSEVLHKPTSSLDVPDLQAIAKDSNLTAILILCRLTIVIGVQCDQNREFIDKIQQLSETDQHHLMKAIEQVISKIAHISDSEYNEEAMTEDDHYYRIQSERRQISNEKDTLEKVYQTLMEEHRQLQTSFDDAISEKEDALAQVRQLRREAESRRSEKADVMMRAEMDRLRADLQKSEDNLAIAESELDKQSNVISDLTRKTEELQVKADEAVLLKDKVDEYRHAAEKLHKTENVMEKYKKKLQESADLRQHVKSLEKQNADLVDKNAALEDEYRKVSAFKPLMESYKNQIMDLESKSASKSQEIDKLNFELDQARTKLKITTEERAKDAEALELYQERVRELELTSTIRSRPSNSESLKSPPLTQGETVPLSTELNEEPNSAVDLEVDDHREQGLGGELDDAITGTTMTDLKLQIRKLTRELESVRKNEADASRILVLENLLEDSNRLKARYESDYLAAHREKLILQRDLEEIRNGKTLGDGPEAAIALRQRLNETVDSLEAIRKEHAELEVKFDTINRELTIAKSDLTLVNKDQLDILASLRESVNEDKQGLEADVARLQKHNKELGEKNRMQLEQINGLLLEKVNLQSEGIGHREKLLQRERVLGDLRASMAGKDLPEEFKQKLLAVHEENVTLKESYKTTVDKLNKAKQFIKSQDKLFKEQHAISVASAAHGTFEEAEASFRSQIKVLEEDVAREKRLKQEIMRRYATEQELMLGAIHNIGMKTIRQHLRNPTRIEKTSFLSIERNRNSYSVQSDIGGR
ncbi:HOOK protein-domain-containing protein [Panaeolus papilionaceus]|nr:HOOK protein-domain-containing protein [Panaeolus papilionaceus]